MYNYYKCPKFQTLPLTANLWVSQVTRNEVFSNWPHSEVSKILDVAFCIHCMQSWYFTLQNFTITM